MKKQKSLADKIGDKLLIAKPKDKPTEKQIIITMSIYLLILLSAFIFFALQLDAARQENLQLKNEKADAFCKSQSYEAKTIVDKTLERGKGVWCNYRVSDSEISECWTAETRNFETGYYNQTDNSYYCQEQDKNTFPLREESGDFQPIGYPFE